MPATLLLLAQVIAAPIQAASDDRPVRLWLGPSPVTQGAAIPVYVAAARDGYLLVLRVATDGRVTVVFPADPKSNGFVARGAYTLRAPGGQPALVVNERSGTGLVLAALAQTPFRFGEFTRAGRFDAGLLVASYPGADGPGTLTDIAQRMLGDGWFNSDFALYTVRSAATAAALARRQAQAESASDLQDPRADARGQNGEGTPVIVFQTVSPEPVLEQTVVERTIVEPVLIIASVCEPGTGGCHPSGFHRRRHDRREPPVKTSGVCQIGSDCPPGVGAPAKVLALGMSPIRRPQAPVTPPVPQQPAIPVPPPAQVERLVTRSKPVTYVVMSAPPAAASVVQPPRTVTLPRGGTTTAAGGTRTITSRQAGTALRPAKILPRVH